MLWFSCICIAVDCWHLRLNCGVYLLLRSLKNWSIRWTMPCFELNVWTLVLNTYQPLTWHRMAWQLITYYITVERSSRWGNVCTWDIHLGSLMGEDNWWTYWCSSQTRLYSTACYTCHLLACLWETCHTGKFCCKFSERQQWYYLPLLRRLVQASH